ncbi:MAG: hypothetical protein CMH49_03290 [Myxococcales bacterium]|nr:hypothetical protein [Myxococcales bacterium]
MSSLISTEPLLENLFNTEAQNLLDSNQDIIALGTVHELKFTETVFRAEMNKEEQKLVIQGLKEWKSLWRLLPQSLTSLNPETHPIYFQGLIEIAGKSTYVLSQSLSSTQFIFLLGLPSLSPEQAKFYLERSLQSLKYQLQSPIHSQNVE